MGVDGGQVGGWVGWAHCRFVESAMHVHCTTKALDARQHTYEAIVFSKQQAERQPPTVLSLALRFHAAMQEKAREAGRNWDALSLGDKEELLDECFEEYNSYGIVATNEKYQLKYRDTNSCKNLTLYVCPEALKIIQGVLDNYKERDSPYAVHSLDSTRWLLGRKSSTARGGAASDIWDAIMTTNPAKQVLHQQRIVSMHRRNALHCAGSSIPKISVDVWNSELAYCCWLGHGLALCAGAKVVSPDYCETIAKFTEAQIEDIKRRGLEGDYKDRLDGV